MILTKKFFFLLLFVGVLNQTTLGQAVNRDNLTVEGYYGIPDWWKLLFGTISTASGVYKINTTGIGPWGARLDYIITKRLGFGADIWYVHTNINGTYTPTNAPGSSNVFFTAKLTRLNIIPRLTIHLSHHEKLDPYIHFGVGYLYSTYRFSSSNRGVFDEPNPLPPITARLGMGLKYLLKPDLGLVVDVGLGGPLISLGIFKKWNKNEKEE